MLKRSKSHLRHNVVAYLALFLALGGTAVAAKPLVTGADVEDGSLTGADIKNDSLIGQQVLQESLGAVPVAGFASTASHARTAGSVNQGILSAPDPSPLFESSVFGLEISGNCGVLRLRPAPGRVPPDVAYGYSFGDNDESGFFGAIPGDDFTIEGANLIMSLVVGRDTSFARVEIVKRGCKFTRWIIRSEGGNGL